MKSNEIKLLKLPSYAATRISNLSRGYASYRMSNASEGHLDRISTVSPQSGGGQDRTSGLPTYSTALSCECSV
eukprot:4032136-Pleurochrysis_carterae.AAC.2